MAGFCEHGNETTCSIKYGECREQRRTDYEARTNINYNLFVVQKCSAVL